MPKDQEGLFRMLAASAHLVAKGQMSAAEGRAVADLANRASQVLKRLGGMKPQLTADDLRGQSMDQLKALVGQLFGKLSPDGDTARTTVGASGQPIPEHGEDAGITQGGRREDAGIGPGVAKVLELLKQEPAA